MSNVQMLIITVGLISLFMIILLGPKWAEAISSAMLIVFGLIVEGLDVHIFHMVAFIILFMIIIYCSDLIRLFGVCVTAFLIFTIII